MEAPVRDLSPLTLAFVGDCIYDLILRTVIVERHNASPNQLHREKSRLAKAPAQAEMAEVLQEHRTQEELAVSRRGRNANSHTTAKNASVLDYRKATGLEALYGWLYLSGQEERLLQLLRLSLDELGWKL